jgi:rhodanese-related sulfurtransferase
VLVLCCNAQVWRLALLNQFRVIPEAFVVADTAQALVGKWGHSSFFRSEQLKPPYHFLLAVLLSFNASAGDDGFLTPGLTAEAVLARLGTDAAPLVVDLRSPIEYGIAHIPGAVNIPLEKIEERLDEFRHDNGVLIYCINGSRTLRAEPVLLANDIENVYHLEGSFQGWLKDEYPYEKGGVKKTGW